MMANTTTRMTTATPWHLWVMGLLALLWNGYGAYLYLMSQTRNPGYMAQFTAEQQAYLDSYPMWMDAVWAVGVWGGVLGAVLLLLRMRWAVWAFMASVIALAVSLIHGQTSGGADIMGSSVVFDSVIAFVAVLLAIYAARLMKRGVLR
jgi:hypothetical protein